MNNEEYKHLHSYQDQKDELNEHLDKLSTKILAELWSDDSSIQEAFTESLVESNDYVAIVKLCNVNNSALMLGAITLELIGVYLTRLAEERAENELI
jgi:hypothetical protein